jgi:Family of unknown function (DUF6152)
MGAHPTTPRLLRRGSAAVVLALLCSSPALARHHSAPLNYDLSRRITIEGTITEMTWRNPHARLRVDVVGSDGLPAEWLAEMNAVNSLKRTGFPMERFHLGDRVSITGFPGRRDRTILLIEVTLSDGSRLVPVEPRPAAK